MFLLFSYNIFSTDPYTIQGPYVISSNLTSNKNKRMKMVIEAFSLVNQQIRETVFSATKLYPVHNCRANSQSVNTFNI